MEPGVLDSPAKHIDLLPKLRLAKRRFALRRVRCRRSQAPGGNGKRARSMSGLMSGSTLYDTVLLLSIVAAIVAGVWLLWRI
jgi:hypothetical protein